MSSGCLLNKTSLSNFRWVFFFLVSLGMHPQHVEVLRLGIQSELQLLAYTTATKCEIQATTAIYTMAHSNAGSPSTEQGQGWNPCPHGYYMGTLLLSHSGNSTVYFLSVDIRKDLVV